MQRLSLAVRYTLHPAYWLGQRLHLAGINPAAAAITAAIAALTLAVSAADRQLIRACHSAGQPVESCTLKVSGR